MNRTFPLTVPIRFVACCLLLAGWSGSGIHAQIVTDGSFSPASQLAGPNYQIAESLGARAGDNLFHSFSQFSLSSGESATFSGSAGLSNVISRVTGGQLSSLDGTIRSSIAGANFFFINPAGIVVGANASFDVGGSLHLSTADYLRFGDGQTFSARSAGGGLSVAPIESFGFLGADAAPITLNGSGGSVATDSGPAIRAAAGRNLTLSAGAIALDAGVVPSADGNFALVTSLGGEVVFSAVDSVGEVPVAAQAVGTASLRGPVTLEGASAVRQLDGAGIFIRGGQVRIGSEAQVQSIGLGVAAGPVEIDAATLAISDTAAVFTASGGPGGSADTRVTASNAIRIENRPGPDVSGRIFTGILNFGTEVNGADTGAIRLTAPLIVISGAQSVVDTSSLGTTSPGGIHLTATEQVTVQDGIMDTRSLTGRADAGEITVQAPTILLSGASLRAGAGIESAPDPLAQGRGSTVQLNGDAIAMNGATVSVSSSSAGAAGTIAIDARQVRLEGSRLRANANLSGDSGQIDIRADESFVAGSSFLNTDTGRATGTDPAIANAGALRISAPLIEISLSGVTANTRGNRSGADIQLSGNTVRLTDTAILSEAGERSINQVADNNGQSGSITISANDELTLQSSAVSTLANELGDGGDIRLSGGQLSLGESFLEAGTTGAGTSGVIVVDAASLQMGGRSGITTSSVSPVVDGQVISSQLPDGSAGRLSIVASGPIRISGQSLVSSSTVGNGQGGDIDIRAQQLTLEDRSSVLADSFSTNPSANAGSISITLNDSLELRDGSGISTQTRTSDGGTITIQLPNRLILRDSSITTSVAGTGNGGNISIDPDFIILDRGRILASAVNGDGGNIQLVINDGGALIFSPDSLVNASSSFGVDGQIEVTAPDQDVAGALRGLDTAFADPNAVGRQPCAAPGALRGRFVIIAQRHQATLAGALPEPHAIVGAKGSLASAETPGARGHRRLALRLTNRCLTN